MISRRTVDQIGRHVLITVAALSAVACAGGGGGGSSPGGSIASPPSPPSPPPPPPPPPGPSTSSAAYTQNYALAAINADAAYVTGATGKGVTVAVIDTGVNPAAPDLVGQVSSLSTDIVPGRNQPVGTDLHATYVASVIAASWPGSDTIGVAYGSTILSIRADTSTGCTMGAADCFADSNLTAAILYAVANGAKVINLSLGGPGEQSPAFEFALNQAVKAGLVVTVAAGNEGNANPDYPAMYAVDPRFQGSVVAVGATTQAGVLASYSNQAGTAAAGYLAAPGDQVITDCNGNTCESVSGTSFAAPQVAGSLALLLQAFPNLTGPQALAILFETATPESNTAMYGVGLLNLTNAFKPIGTLSVTTASGAVIAVSTQSGGYVASAFGDALSSSKSLTVAGLDAYHRLFAVNLGQLYHNGGTSLISVEPALLPRQTDVAMPAFADGSLRLAASLPDPAVPDPSTVFRWMKPPTGAGDVTLTYQNRGLTLMAWRGAGVANPFSAPMVDPFTALAMPDHAFRADFTQGRFSFSTEAGAGDRLSPDRTVEQTGSSYVRATGQANIGGVTTAFTTGELVEPLGPLGSYLPSTSGLALPSRTGFLTLSQSWAVAPGFRFGGYVSAGHTQIVGQILSLQQAAWSSSWRMNLDGDCRRLGLLCWGVELSLSQPLRMETGSFQAVLPDVPSTYQINDFTYSTRTVGVAPSGRQLDLRLAADEDFGAAGVLRLEGVVSREPANVAEAPPAMGVDANWRLRF